ncbi:Calcium-binding protein CML24 [Linum perenne]
MAKQSDAESPIVVGCTEEIRQIFDKFDKNGDGKISCSEVVESLKELGTAVTSAEVECMMKEFDKDGDGYIDLDEFVGFIHDMDKNGLISANELHAVMKMLGLKCSMGDCKKMIRQVDQDGDGSVNFEEFKKMMASGNRAPAA